MEIMVTIPDGIAHSMLREGHDPSREILELLILSALRDGRIYESEAVAMLGMNSRFELWAWLKNVDPMAGADTIESGWEPPCRRDIRHLSLGENCGSDVPG